MRVVRTSTGARLEHGELILSEMRGDPGPTDSLFDVLAACMSALIPGHEALLLGFAGGGLIAPLRAMGFGHPLDAVDLSLEMEPLFRELSEPWCGEVRLHEAEASAFLRASRKRYDLILEDLSVEIADDDVTKPDVSLEVLPALMKRRLRPRGIVVTNVLPVPGWSWKRLLPHLASPFAEACVIELEVWENRVLIAGDAVPSARAVSDEVRNALRVIGSAEARRLSVRKLT